MIVLKIGTGCIDWAQLYALYERVGLVAGLAQKGHAKDVRNAFERSHRVVTAWEGDIMMGAGRMLSDGICYGAIFDLGVLPEFQKRGVGREILQALLKDNDHLHVYLTSTFGNEGFYKKCGFKKHKTAMAKYPFNSDYLED